MERGDICTEILTAYKYDIFRGVSVYLFIPNHHVMDVLVQVHTVIGRMSAYVPE